MKTVPNSNNVNEFIAGVSHSQRRSDAEFLIPFFKEITGKEPVMWGPSIIGFDRYHYSYPSGSEGDMCLTGFSPRKQHTVVYVMNGLDAYSKELEVLGPHKRGRSCLYIKRIQDIDIHVLKGIVTDSVSRIKERYS